MLLSLLTPYGAIAALSGNVTVANPANGTVTNGNVSISINLPSDPVNVTVSVNGTGGYFLLNQTDNITTATFNVTWQTGNGSFADGTYNITVLALNGSNSSDNATVIAGNIIADNGPPSLSLLSPGAGANLSSSSVSFNWSANDTIDTNLTCLFSLNGSVNQTVYGNGTLNATLTLADGNWNWSVACNDTAGNQNTSVTRAFAVDTTSPAVTNASTNATRNATKANSTIRVDVSVTDLIGVTVNLSNGTTRPMALVSGNLYRYTGNSTDLGCPANGTCVLAINATDILGHENATVTLTITVDDLAPNITNVTVSSIGSDEATVAANADEQVLFTLRYGTSADLTSTNASGAYGTSYSYTIEGLTQGTVHYYNITACDAAGNCVTNGTNTFTTSTLSSGGGGSGGGGYVPPATTVEAKHGRVWSSVSAGTLSYVPSGVAISEILLTFVNDASRVKIDITQHKDRPGSIRPLDDATVYRYLEIAHEGLVGNVASYRISFAVPVSWLSEQGLAADGIAIYRLENGTWTPYGATIGGVTDGTQSFTADVPGFSAFAIAAAAQEAIAEVAAEESSTAETPIGTQSEPVQESPAPLTVSTGEKKESGVLTTILTVFGAIGLLVAGAVAGVHQYRAGKRNELEHEQRLAKEKEALDRLRSQTSDRRDARETAAKAAEDAQRKMTAQDETPEAAQRPEPARVSILAPEHPVFHHPQYHTHVAPLREYIRKARDHGLKDPQIAERLSLAGWGAHVIEHELGRSPRQ